MEQTGVDAKEIREVEFRERMRGYHQDDVDQFLERVAVGVEFLEARLAEAEEEIAMLRSRPAQVVTEVAREITAPDDIIQRTLLLAQKTADSVEREARERAHEVVVQAQAEAERLKDETHGLIRRLEAEQRARLEVERRESARQVEATRAVLIELTSRVREVQDHIRSQLTGVLAMVATIETPEIDLAQVDTVVTDQGLDSVVPLTSEDEMLDPFAAANEISDSFEVLDGDAVLDDEEILYDEGDEGVSKEPVREYSEDSRSEGMASWGSEVGRLDFGVDDGSSYDEDDDIAPSPRFELKLDDDETSIPSLQFEPEGGSQSVQEFVFGQDKTEDTEDGSPFLLWHDE